MTKFNHPEISRILALVLLFQIHVSVPAICIRDTNADQVKGTNSNKHQIENIRKRNILLVVGNTDILNDSEKLIIARLEGKGARVRFINDTTVYDTKRINLIIISKTVTSLNIGTRYKNVSCGLMTWEDNLQMKHLLGFSDNDGSEGTAFHRKNQEWHIPPGTPEILTSGITGAIKAYIQPDEMTYFPVASTIPESAIVVAELYPDNRYKSCYVFEKGAITGDGTSASGRRIYFGLYDNTFRLLTDEALILFDAAVAWGSALKKL